MTQPPAFDPRLVPVDGVDQHLPAVHAQCLLPEALVQRFASGHTWSPELRGEPRFTQRAPVEAAVLIALVERPGGLTVLLTQRTAHLSSHSGQIAFPGGKADPQDTDAQATALREAHEEINLDPGLVRVIGNLPVYTTGSAYIVTPVVALVPPVLELKPNPHEVADVFEVPLAYLMNPANHRRHAVQWEGMRREWFSMPYTDQHAERFIWGATAGMLRNLYRFLQE